jgi:tetratricopeptide (TPR) repeat protein
MSKSAVFRCAVLFAVVLLCCAGVGQAAPAAPEPDFVPFFGGIKKTPAQQEHDHQVVAEAIRRAGSREQAVTLVLQSGWAKLKSGEAETAIKYFNLAWLIEPSNPDVLWGFGASLNQQRKFEPALRLFELARQQKPKEAALLADYAYAWISKGALADKGVDQREASFAKALELLDQSEKLNPGNPIIYSNRAMLRYFQVRYLDAWHQVAKAEALAPHSINPMFLRDLSARMPRPKGL